MALRDVEFMNGLVRINTEDNLEAIEITAEKYNVLEESDGNNIIPIGETNIFIDTTIITENSMVFTSPITPISQPLIISEKVDGEGF